MRLNHIPYEEDVMVSLEVEGEFLFVGPDFAREVGGDAEAQSAVQGSLVMM